MLPFFCFSKSTPCSPLFEAIYHPNQVPVMIFTEPERKSHAYASKALIVVLSLFFTQPIFAQRDRQPKTNEVFLKKNGLELAKSMKKEKERAWDLAKKKGWPTFQLTKQGRIIRLVGVDDQGLPLYDATDNEVAAGTTNANKLYTGGGLGLSLSGSTIPNNKIAIWDGGAVLATHQEFATGRVIVKNATSLSSHSTHVAGTIAASGVYSSAKGMAYGLPNLLTYDFDGDNAEMSTNAPNLILSNHSYGVVAGWGKNSDKSDRWEFRGNWGDNEDYKFGYYDSKAQTWDDLCYNAPYYLPVKSAGNYRNDNGPAVGAAYYRYNTSGTMVSAGNRPAGMSSNDGYGIIGTYGNAKNILTVGAVNGLKYGSSSPSDVVMSSFSAWGPTDDGRIKPDLVADGVGLISTTSTGTANYATSSGTSMSAPNATGTMVLLQELYNQKYSAFMRSATLKGLVLGTTSEAGTALGPDYIFGWGLLNAEKAAKAILNNNVKSLISERVLVQGETQTINLVASGNGPLVATICWTDPAITPVSSSNALNNTTLRLVNDLDSRIGDGSTTYSPWILDPANPAVAATTGDNFRDNVEQIYIANAVPGKSYTLTVTHKGNLQSGAQAFSVIVTGVGGTNYCLSSATNNADSKITNFSLANINHTPVANCTTYGDYTNQTISLEKGKAYNLNLALGTCGANASKIAKVFVDWNGDGDFDDAGETVATTGVITATGNYSTSITVPTLATTDDFSLLRIVLVETANAEDVLACGNYLKGETQEYRVKFLGTSINASLTHIVTPPSNCANANQTVVVNIKNTGALSISKVPVTVTIVENTTTVATLTGVFNGVIGPLAESSFIVPGSFNAQAGKTYSITAKVNFVGDLDSSDDQVSSSLQVAGVPTISSTSTAYYCTNTSSYLLSSNETQTLYWYKTPTDVSPFAIGNNSSTTSAPTTNNSYYVGLNDFTATVGATTKYHSDMGSGSGSYGENLYNVYVTALAPMLIESARLYVGTAGVVTFYVKNSEGVTVSTSTISVDRTRSSNGTSNDTNDQGRVYVLNLSLPTAGNYTLSATYDGGATLFRSSAATGTYPYSTAADIFQITGQNGSAGSPNAFYYLFYGMKVKALGCASTVKLQVPVSKPVITRLGSIFNSNFTIGNKWYFNGSIINGATADTYQPTQSGNYVVKVTIAGGCELVSDTFNFDIASLPIELTAFSANRTSGGAILRWTTATETNNDRFEVYRAGDDGVSIKVGTVLAKGAGSYSLLDKTPIIGNNYYSLKQVDKNGVITTYGPYSLNFTVDETNAGFTIYPNPSKRSSDIKFLTASKSKSYQLTVTNLLGQKVATSTIRGDKLINGYQLNTLNWAAGTYLIEISELSTGKSVGWNKLIKL